MSRKIYALILAIVIIILIGITKIEPENTYWTVTQFGDNVGGQMMCFTIEGNKNGLVIIDGGYENNEEQYNFLKTKIEKNNGIVDTWIITHLDPDHVGAFLRIQKENEVKINKIYVQDAPNSLELLKENAPNETEWEQYQDFMSLNLEQKILVHSGEEFENIIGLKMKILSSYADWIDEKTNNLLNNGSVVFKLYGKTEAMLFCGDVQSKCIGEYLLENYKEDLHSDYLQVGHHGNNNLEEEFYKTVNPKASFFSAPDWLMYNENKVEWFTVEKNRKILEDLGSDIYWHNTSPNEIVLH